MPRQSSTAVVSIGTAAPGHLLGARPARANSSPVSRRVMPLTVGGEQVKNGPGRACKGRAAITSSRRWMTTPAKGKPRRIFGS